MPAVQERRASARIDKVFRVLISTDETGDQWCIARNISDSGMFVEMADPLPLRTKVIVRFCRQDEDGDEDGAICAMARVQNHYYLQFSDGEGLRAIAGVGLRLLRFVAEAGTQPLRHRLH
jgi:hypothetical protein